MTASLAGVYNAQFSTDAGAPAAGYRLYTYSPGTTTLKLAYTEPTGTTAHTYVSDGLGGSYIASNARGELAAPLFLTSGGYDLTLKTGAGATVWTRRAYGTGDDASSLRDDLSASNDASKGPGLLGYAVATAYAYGTFGAAVRDGAVNALWFCASSAERAAILAKSYATDNTATLAAALAWAAGRAVYLPAGGWKVSALTLGQAGQEVYGDGEATIVRGSDPSQHLFTVTADGVMIRDMCLQGTATAATYNRFAVYTTSSTPAQRLRVRAVKFSSEDSSKGFTNAVKFDDGCHSGEVSGCYIERLVGSSSGYGYGVLVGAANDVQIIGNWWIGSAGRGRHGYYLSAGASRCRVIANLADSPEYEGITIYSQGAQPACADNVVAHNTVRNASRASAALAGSGISVFGHATRNAIIGNTVTGSYACGIKIDGTGATDLAETHLAGNTVTGAAYIGIDVIAGVGGMISGGSVTDSGGAAVGSYPNIRLAADGTTGSTRWLINGVRVPASTVSRSAVQLNGTAPLPTGGAVKGCLLGAGTVTDVEALGGSWIAVDGRLRLSGTYNPPSIINGASDVSSWSIPGAAVGDVVTVAHGSDTDGCVIFGRVSAADTVLVTIANLSGATKDIASGPINIDVWKRSP